MRKNIDAFERPIRILIGFAIIAIGIYYMSLWYLAGVEIVLTGILGWSPIYKLIDLSIPHHTTKHNPYFRI